MITIGIDPHKSSLTAVTLDPTGHPEADVQSVRRLAATFVIGEVTAVQGFYDCHRPHWKEHYERAGNQANRRLEHRSCSRRGGGFAGLARGMPWLW
jgi:hypothetical protein